MAGRRAIQQKGQLELELPFQEAHGGRDDWITTMSRILDFQFGPAWPDRFGESIRSWFVRRGTRPIRTLSLFSGAGGLDIGFSDCGFQIVEMVEIESQYTKTLKANIDDSCLMAGSRVNCIDIRQYKPSHDLSIDFIIGGPPCQAFSAAGRRAAGVQGTKDPRGMLFKEYIRVLKTINPKGFLFENVYGITGANGGKAWQEIKEGFAEAGYDLYYRVLDAADYGVPQHRERLIIVGVRKGEKQFKFPLPTHGPDSPCGTAFYTASQAVSGADEKDDASLSINGRWGHLIADIPPGLNYSYYTAELGHPRPVFAWRSKFSDFLYKADPDSPVRTIKAQGGLYTGPFSWNNRHFSTCELKRLQTIPDSYIICGSRPERIKQIGNSVPPQLARILALAVICQLFGVTIPAALPLMDPSFRLGFRTRKRLLSERYASLAQKAIVKIQKSESCEKQCQLRSYQAYLSSSFDLKEHSRASSIAFTIRQSLVDHHLVVQCIRNDCLDKEEYFQIEVSPSLSGWVIPLKIVTARGSDLSRATFTATWKAIERAISASYGIDDLVQLCGYYQYQPRLKASLSIPSSECLTWNTITKVVSGLGVGRQLPLITYADLWETEESSIIEIMKYLRSIGYEVRNHKTNPQIPEGEFLIPYAFPTLNSRSVQLHKQF